MFDVLNDIHYYDGVNNKFYGVGLLINNSKAIFSYKSKIDIVLENQ